jgi:tetratricopeptide (TPR) repeat protein
MLKKLNDTLITRLFFVIFQFVLLILLIAPCYSRNYSQQDLDNVMKAGNNAYDKGDYNGAMEEYTKAVTISKTLYGKESIQTAYCYNNLGETYQAKGDYNKAMSYHEKALTIGLKTLGPGHPDIATFYNNLGTDIYYDKGD